MPNTREGALHAARQKIISNKALRLGAIEAGIPPYIQSKPVVPKIWQPCLYGSEDDQPGESTEVTEEGSSVDTVDTTAHSAKRPLGGKRKRQRDEHSIQWLGDKVHLDASALISRLIGLADGCGRRRSRHWRGIPHHGERLGAACCENSACPSRGDRTVVGLRAPAQHVGREQVSASGGGEERRAGYSRLRFQAARGACRSIGTW